MKEDRHGYRLGDILGRNVHGGRLTYAAVRLVDDLDVIVKQFSFAREDADWAGFKAHQRELEMLQSLDHEAIPDFLDAFQVEDGFWLVQERVQAPSLASRRYWSFEEVEQIARQLLDILIYLQDRHPPIIHRDFKPENILRHDGGQVHLIDFGLARDAQREGSSSTVAAGTPGFMAPEQFFNTGVDERTDLYGLGATLYALLAGISTEEMRLHVSTAFVFDFAKLPEDTPSPFRAWLETLTHPEKEDRFESARRARAALDAAFAAIENEHKAAASTETKNLPSPRQASRGSAKIPLGDGTDSSNAMLEHWSKQAEDSSPKSAGSRALDQAAKGFFIAVGLVILGAISIPIAWRIPQDSAPSFLHPWLQTAKVIRMPGEGGSYACRSGLSIELEAGKYGAPKSLESIYASNGCRIRLKGIEVRTINARVDSTIELIDAQVDSIHAERANLSMNGGFVRLINISKSTGTLSNITGQDLSIAEHSKFEANDVKFTNLRMHDSASMHARRLQLSQGGNLSGKSTLVAETVKLTGPLSLSEDAILVLRDPILSKPLPADRHTLVLKPGEDTEQEVEAFIAQARREDERRTKEKEQKQALWDLQNILHKNGCREVGACVSSAHGEHAARLDFSGGKIELVSGPECLKADLSKLEKYKALQGTLECQYKIYDQNGATVVDVNTRFKDTKPKK